VNAFERVRAPARADQLIGWGLFAAAFAALWATQRAVGYTRDESFYFFAAANHAGWFELLFSRPALAFDDVQIVRYFDYNHEHPALMKDLFGLSHWILHRRLGWLGPALSFRLPAFALAALIAPLLYRMGAALYGRAAGLFAAIAFFLVPRHFFNAQLACFDVPMAAFWLLTVYAFWRAQQRPGTWWACGIAFGLALSTKHNAFFLPLVLAPVAAWLAWKRSAANPAARELVRAFLLLSGVVAALFGFLWIILGPRQFQERFLLLSPHTFLLLALVAGSAMLLRRLKSVDEPSLRPLASLAAMGVLGPLILYVTWPYLWHHPVERIAWWLQFHATHVHYAWFYLGRLLREPPFPLDYVLVKTALTVPTSLLVPMALGLLGVSARVLARGSASVASASGQRWPEVLVLLNAIASIALISHPRVPHFGGVKHWLPSMTFLALLSGYAVSGAVGWAAGAMKGRRFAPPAWSVWGVVALTILAPALWASIRIHPYGTSAYSELAGGAPGAATLGMQRQFWSSNVTGVLPWINAHAPPNARVWLHEVTQLAFVDYQRNGLMRRDLRPANGPHDADVAAYQYHQEFREHEFNIWQVFQTRRPSTGLYIDETPQVVVYTRR
jgi:4-amino-4-deoxy-L-arabinose transferase-like glycosyltransferase